jgi:TRAP-type C4-dicarboxylate transport system substrate-binding protein
MIDRRELIAGSLATAAVAGLPAHALAQTKWKGVATSRPTPHFGIWEWFAAEAQKRTNGQVSGEVVSLPELGLSGFELVRVTRAGLVDFADIILAYVSGEIPIVEAVDLPGLYSNIDASVKAHAAFLPAVRKYEDKLGGIVLGGYIWPGQYLFTKKPVRSAADLKGQKVRVYGSAQTELARHLGMEPVAMAFAEVYTGLERGTIDAAITGSYPGFAIKLFEVSKYVVDIAHGPNSGVLVVSKRSWDRLTPDQQGTMRKLGDEFSEKGWEIGRRTDKEGLDENKKKGMEIIPLSAAFAAGTREALQKVILPSWAKRSGPDAKAVFNQYIAPVAGISVP